MSDIDLNAIQARVDAMPDERWAADHESAFREVVSSSRIIVNEWGDWIEGKDREALAEFVAHARQDIPDLLAEVERLTEERDGTRRIADDAIAQANREKVQREAVEQERDKYAAVIEVSEHADCSSSPLSFGSADEGFYADRCDCHKSMIPASALIARDAEKKAEALEEMAQIIDEAMVEIGDEAMAVELRYRAQLHRTPQQGAGDTMLSRIAKASERLSQGSNPQQGEPE
jgi:hypothetical protein